MNYEMNGEIVQQLRQRTIRKNKFKQVIPQTRDRVPIITTQTRAQRQI